MRSTIHSPCPQCKDTTLIQHLGASYKCAACNFDYLVLRNDEPAREAWMLTALQSGVAGKLAVLFLHRVIMDVPVQISNAQVLAFAERHAIPMPTGKPTHPGVIAGAIIAVFVVLMAIGFALSR